MVNGAGEHKTDCIKLHLMVKTVHYVPSCMEKVRAEASVWGMFLSDTLQPYAQILSVYLSEVKWSEGFGLQKNGSPSIYKV